MGEVAFKDATLPLCVRCAAKEKGEFIA